MRWCQMSDNSPGHAVDQNKGRGTYREFSANPQVSIQERRKGREARNSVSGAQAAQGEAICSAAAVTPL